MRAFCGWLDASGEAAHTAVDMLAAERPGAPIETRGAPGWALALAGGPGDATLLEAEGACSVQIGRPGAACAAGGEHVAALQQRADGAYALARVDPSQRRVHLQVDRFSTYPIYYALAGDGIVFGSSPRVVAAHPRVDPAISEQSLFEYFHATNVPAPATIFRSVRALEPGTCLDFVRGQTSVRAHWEPEFDEAGPSRIGTGAQAQVLDLMRAAVAGSARGTSRPGAFLSGGIDSSTVVGCLRDTGREPPRTFSIGFAVDDYDELGYARTVAQHFGAEYQQYYVTAADVVALLPRLARAFGQPFGNASVVPAFHCARLAAEHGVTCMLAGDGGDELFGGNERYGRDWLFSRYAGLPAPARRALEAWAGAAAPPLGGLPVLRKALSYVRHARVPLPARLDVFNYLNVLGAARLFADGFLDAVDPHAPAAARRALFDGARAHSDINRMLAMEFKTTLADNDLQKVVVMCREAGVDVRFPFLADEVVDFSLHLPPHDKVSRTRLRCFFRAAVTGYLPDAVISKQKRGFGLPFGIWASQPGELRECVFDLLGSARRRGIVAAALIDDLTGGLLDREPRYYGPLVWLIIVLESWLSENT